MTVRLARRKASWDLGKDWVDAELAGCHFPDIRLGKRLHSLMESMAEDVGGSIPVACEDWAAAKAAYRFFSNDDVSDQEILAGHFEATRGRAAASKGHILVLHDTTEFTFKRGDGSAIGWTNRLHLKTANGRGPERQHTMCGVFMHGSLAVTTQGLPLGLAAVKLWTRKELGVRKSLTKHECRSLPIGEKESYRWIENLQQSTLRLGAAGRCVHIGDREADIFALFSAAGEIGTHFLVRICNDRLADDGETRVASVMKEVPVAGTHQVTFTDSRGVAQQADLAIKYRRLTIVPSPAKRKDLSPLEVTVIYAIEKTKPKNRPRIEWKLVTDLGVGSLNQAIEKLDWYAMRWKIETYHKILKSGCQIEASKMQTAHRLINLIAVSCILGWRVFWMTMINRTGRNIPPETALTDLERQLLDLRVKDKAPVARKDLHYYLTKIARLGGYLNRASDPPPGNIVMWRGLSKLADMTIGAEIALGDVGK
jgi:hypothetical protein